MKPMPEREHAWLQRLVGEWTYQGEAAEPGGATHTFEGRELVRSVGDLWICAEGTGEMPGGGVAQSITTLGFEPRSRRFVGTWIGTMIAYLWVYDGALDEQERVLTLSSEGPSMSSEGKMARYRDLIEVESDERRVLRGLYLGDDGSWHEMVSMHYRRVR